MVAGLRPFRDVVFRPSRTPGFRAVAAYRLVPTHATGLHDLMLDGHIPAGGVRLGVRIDVFGGDTTVARLLRVCTRSARVFERVTSWAWWPAPPLAVALSLGDAAE
jgi:hypothetical protein